MTRRKKRALIKKGIRLLEPVLREEAALAPAVGRKLKSAEDSPLPALPLEKLKRLGLIAGGALAALSLAGSAARAASFRLAVSRELKRQLKPIHEQLDRLEKENAALRAGAEREKKAK